ncbi:recombinase family protein [Herbaspirillum sp. NPDC087042]|uniref:recombinase family protein n=1 Tax=Herbaspirillum sp. NPDC087042 TaxID=3364004 RepID=UPI00382AD244
MTSSVKAYSYIRMSTEIQQKGHSEQRQRELSENYAKLHGLELVDQSVYKDIGVSAFRSTNLESGALGQFVTALKSGKIARGSVLLVESLDRLSRDSSHIALRLFLVLICSQI